MLSLDRTRKFSTVHGEDTRGIAFFQDGFPFDARGQLHEPALTDELRKKLGPKPQKAAKVKAEKAPRPARPDATAEGDKGEVNLTAWLKGEVRYKPFQVFAATRKRTGVAVTSIVEAARLLVFEQKIVTEAECKVPLS